MRENVEQRFAQSVDWSAARRRTSGPQWAVNEVCPRQRALSRSRRTRSARTVAAARSDTCRAVLEVSRPSAFEVLAFRPGAVAAAATAVPQRSRVQQNRRRTEQRSDRPILRVARRSRFPEPRRRRGRPDRKDQTRHGSACSPSDPAIREPCAPRGSCPRECQRSARRLRPGRDRA